MKLAEIRYDRGLDVAELARRADMPGDRLRAIEAGQVEPTCAETRRIGRALDVLPWAAEEMAPYAGDITPVIAAIAEANRESDLAALAEARAAGHFVEESFDDDQWQAVVKEVEAGMEYREACLSVAGMSL